MEAARNPRDGRRDGPGDRLATRVLGEGKPLGPPGRGVRAWDRQAGPRLAGLKAARPRPWPLPTGTTLAPGTVAGRRSRERRPVSRKPRASTCLHLLSEDMSRGDPPARQGYEVVGRVQGVGFRWSTTQTARRLGLGGTVRNRDDGAVEVHVKGPSDAVRELEDWLQEGPRAARVDEVREIPARDELPDRFQIIR